MSHRLKVKVNNKWYTVDIEDLETTPIRAIVDGEIVDVDVENLVVTEGIDLIGLSGSPEEGKPIECLGSRQDSQLVGQQPVPGIARPPEPVKAFRAPMPGGIISVSVRVGDQVITGDEICILEAMKMRQSLRADWSGVVKAVRVLPGQQVREGDLIVELE